MDAAERISRLSPEQRKLLEQKLQKENIDILKLSINKPKRWPDQESSGQQRFPLSFAQERLWFIQQLDPDNYAYNITKLLKLEGILDKQALEQSINEIIKRHEILRTVFIPESAGPVQVILDRLSLSLNTIDLRDPAKNQEDEIRRIIQEESQYVFDLSQGPLLRTRLLILEEKKYIFLLVIHHIICDGTSFQVFFRELMEFYQFFSRGKPMNLPQLTIQYANYACWQRQWSNLNTKQAAYWLDQFKGEIPVLQLPTDYPRPSLQGFKGDTLDFYLPGPGVNVLKEMAVKERTTLNVVLLALYNVFLSRLSGQEDIVVGTPIAGRRHPAVKNLIGMFVNTLALRNYPLHHLTLKEFLASVTRRTLKAFDNQEYEYESLVDQLQVNRDTSRNPLFDVMFYLGNIEFPIMDIQGLTLKSYDPDNKTSKFDLLLRAREEGDQLHFYLEYCTSLFKETTIKRFIGYFQQVVAAAVNNKDLDIKLSDLEMLPGEEKKHILYEFNNTSAGYPLNETLDQLFSRQAQQTPDHIAVISRQQHLTYRELARRCGCLAHWLGEKGVQADTIVAVMMERSPEMIIGILGILKAGGGYLPIDVDYPEERIKYMMADSGAKILLTRQEIEDTLSLGIWNLESGISPRQGGHLAYVIYTSGSTGKPKGVILEQQNLVNLLFYSFKCTTLDFSAVLQFSTICFDVSFHEIFTTLVQGGKLCLIDEEMRTNVPELFKLIREKQIKTVFLPMALLKLIFNEPAYISLFPTCVSHIQTAGEQVVINSAFRDFLKTRQIPLHNHYGPSETHVV
ncbi:MAG: AMP-binding protein, partial [Candidatus Aminicenantes bacterium]